jgi:hypothetical protein
MHIYPYVCKNTVNGAKRNGSRSIASSQFAHETATCCSVAAICVSVPARCPPGQAQRPATDGAPARPAGSPSGGVCQAVGQRTSVHAPLEFLPAGSRPRVRPGRHRAGDTTPPGRRLCGFDRGEHGIEVNCLLGKLKVRADTRGRCGCG